MPYHDHTATSQQRAAELRQRRARAAWWAAELKDRNTKLAAQLADTEQALALTLRRLADQWPHHKDKLTGQSRAAIAFAAKARQRAARGQP